MCNQQNTDTLFKRSLNGGGFTVERWYKGERPIRQIPKDRCLGWV